jgi:hypothetical protein
VTTPATEPLAATQRQFLVAVEGCPGYWQRKTGADSTAPVTVVWNGGAARPQKLGGPADLGDMVLTMAYRPKMHRDIKTQYRRNTGRLRVVAHVTELDEDGMAIGDPITYPQALLTGCTDPEVDWASGAQADWSITLSLGDEV